MTSTEHTGFARNWKDIASAFLRLGATSYGGPAILGIMQAELQEKRQWVSRERFVEGLALGQFTPGPVLMVAAYVGYKVAGVAGAAVAAAAAFLPSFILMLAILPVLERVRKLAWTRAVMKGMGPAVIGVLGVSLFGIAPYALPDLFAVAMLVATVIVLSVARIGAVRLMIAGSLLGVLRSRIWARV